MRLGGRGPFGPFGKRVLFSWLVVATSLVVALGVYAGFLGESWISAIATWTAGWTSAVLNLLGADTVVDGTILSSGSFAVNVVAECTAVGPLVLYAGAVAAYPSPWKARGIGIILGLVVLTGVNVLRIASLFWIGQAYPQYLNIAHLIVWQAAMILLAIVLWLLWAEKVAPRARLR
ncbi:MAG: hypothetical protein FJ317_06990 [SAR202 cluster bacterium]|nr:hypothetical protein [SAR202 cluster bacterium]